MIDANTVEPMPELDDPFWHRRTVLTHIHTYARARRVSPWATLGVTMVRAIAATPPTVVLPALIGSRTSLNLFVAPVGPSGAGKDAAEGASRDGILLGDNEIPVVPLGSGEGITRTFRPHGTKPDEPNPIEAAVFSAPEIDTWAALAARSGSTLTAEMRKLYMGATIGFANSGRDTRNIVKAHSYRACGILGVQPLRSGPLLTAADGGLPQRLTWLPATDPDAPDHRPEGFDPITIQTPDWDTAEWVTYSADQIVLSVPPPARHEIDAHRLAVLRGDPDVDPLDGHALLTRLKVAAALMILDGQTVISEEDWELAGAVMAISTATREHCQQALVDQSRRAIQAKAHAVADRDEIVADRRTRRAKDAMLRKLRKGGQLTRSELRRWLKGDIRDYFDAALGEMLDAGEIAVIPGGPAADRYTVDPGSTQSTQALPAETEGGPQVHGGPTPSASTPRRPARRPTARPATPIVSSKSLTEQDRRPAPPTKPTCHDGMDVSAPTKNRRATSAYSKRARPPT